MPHYDCDRDEVTGLSKVTNMRTMDRLLVRMKRACLADLTAHDFTADRRVNLRLEDGGCICCVSWSTKCIPVLSVLSQDSWESRAKKIHWQPTAGMGLALPVPVLLSGQRFFKCLCFAIHLSLSLSSLPLRSPSHLAPHIIHSEGFPSPSFLPWRTNHSCRRFEIVRQMRLSKSPHGKIQNQGNI